MKKMNRNAESHFSIAPTLSPERSTFDRSMEHIFSGMIGDLVPFFRDEVLPGDTFRISTSKVVRLQTPITPIMGNLYLDTYFFFIPRRLIWKHWKEFMGENTESAWAQTTEYTIPQVTSPTTYGWLTGTIADYLGIPTGVPGLSVDACYFRSYAKVVDDWFRDQNLQDPVLIPDGDATAAGSNGKEWISDMALGGYPFIVAKYHDYFTSALPQPQLGPAASIPVLDFGNGIPVYPKKEWVPTDIADGYDTISDGVDPTYDYWAAVQYVRSDDQTSPYFMRKGTSNWTLANTGAGEPQTWETNGANNYSPVNLWAIPMESQFIPTTVSALRTAFQLQRFLEKSARSGSRYIETIKAHFGISSPDARLQRSEYLGGSRVPIVINQVLQTSETSGTPQGTTGAFSLTSDQGDSFTRSFTEHGIILGVCCIRYNHLYQQGIERLFSRRTKYDFYWPVFAHLSEQGIKNKELFAQGIGKDEQVFGYQEAWADYRYAQDRISAQMRSNADGSLDVWHLADDYSSLPTLDGEWIQEDKKIVDRVLAVSSEIADQFFADFYVKNYCTRVMPTFSIPGLIDHY